MNIKPKILNKILSNKIHENIKKVIDAAQVGFILEMYAWFIILKSINILFHISRLKYKMNQKKKRRHREGFRGVPGNRRCFSGVLVLDRDENR